MIGMAVCQQHGLDVGQRMAGAWEPSVEVLPMAICATVNDGQTPALINHTPVHVTRR